MLTVDDLQIDPETAAATAVPNRIQDSGTIAPPSNGLQVCFWVV